MTRISTCRVPRLSGAAIAIAVMSQCSFASAASLRDARDCDSSTDNNRKIAACTALLNEPGSSAANRAHAYFRRGETYYYTSDYALAVADFSEVIHLDPSDDNAFYQRGLNYGMLDNYDRAISDYTEAMRLAKSTLNSKSKYRYTTPLNSRAMSYHFKDEYDNSIADYRELASITPKDDGVHRDLGNVYRDKGDYDRAIDEYNRAIVLKPKDWSSYSYRGDVYRYKGDEARAAADYDQAIKIAARASLPYTYRAEFFWKKGDFDRAIADYTKAIQVEGESSYRAFLYVQRADVFRDQGRLDRALQDYDAATHLNSGNYSNAIHSGRGIALLYSGEAAKALSEFLKANETYPKDVVNALWIDIIAERIGASNRLAQLSGALDLKRWPAPLAFLYSGYATPANVLAAAQAPAPHERRQRLCMANFFIGIWDLRHAAREEASRSLQTAVTTCDGWLPASAELKKLSGGEGSHSHD